MPTRTFNRPGSRALVLGSLVQLACSEQPPLAPTPPQPSLGVSAFTSPPIALDWQQQARTLVAANNLSPLAAGRVFAAVSVAQYGALDDADKQSAADGTVANHGIGAGGRARFEAERGAVAAASKTVLAFLFPAAATTLHQRLQDEATARGKTHPQFQLGLDLGIAMGNTIIARLQADHFTDPWTGTVPVGPGLWVNNGPPAGPLFGTVTPYFMTSGSQFRPPPPPAFGSAAFLADLNEIKLLSVTRTPAQLAIAQFWAFPTGTFTPLGYWNQVAGTYISQYGLNEREATHVFALMHAAMLDAQIGCWDAKYFYWLIRPYQADPSITTPIGQPNHPSYPSGHSCNSSAATLVLAHFFPAQATDLADQLEEAGLSRMYGGIHYRFDITAAVQIGTAVAELALSIDRSQGLLSLIR
jgi:membrane-associated phospholipid phosphatase